MRQDMSHDIQWYHLDDSSFADHLALRNETMSELEERTVQIAPAKLEIPPLPPEFIARPALMERISLLLHQRLTCIVAPLGSGKTCALAEFARFVQSRSGSPLKEKTQTSDPSIVANHHIAWLTVDERDSDPQRFWSHVFASLSRAMNDEHFAAETLRMNDMPITSDSIEYAASLLFDSHECVETILILDGIDKVQNDTIDEQLLHFISYAPREFHVMVSARRLSEKMEYGSYDLGQVQLGYHDLLFSRSEARRILESAARICADGDDTDEGGFDSALSENRFETIYDLSEGWPQGVSLALQSLIACSEHGYPLKFGGASNPVRRYFSSNTKAHVPSELRFAFKVLSLFERFSKPLFKATFASNPDLRDCFDDVVGNCGALVVACDEEGEWYRFNRLFADWIRRSFRSSERHAIRKGCLAASGWFNRKGKYDAEAAKCLLMAVDFGYVSNIVLATSGQKGNVEDEDHFVWISQIPSERFFKSPLLSLSAAWAYNAIGRVVDAEKWLDVFRDVSTSSSKLSEEEALLAIKFLEAKHLAMVGDNQLALKMNEELLMSTHAQEYSLSSMLYQSIGEANERMGKLGIAEEMFLQAQASANVDDTEHHLYFNMFSYAKIRFDLGDFDECEATCRKLLDICPYEFAFRCAGYALLALVHVERNMLEEAEIEVERSLEDAMPYQNIDMYLMAKIAQSTLFAAQGNLADAYESISEAVMHGERTVVPKNALLSAYFKQSEIASRRGNDCDLQLIERKFKMREDARDGYHNSMYQILHGLCLKQQGKIEAATNSYAEAAEGAKQLGASFMEAKALAELLVSEDETTVTRRGAILGRLIQLVDSHGFARVLLDLGAPMRDILRKYSSSSHVNAQTRQFVKGILVLFERELHSANSIEDVQNTHIGKLDNLTAREREVLGLLNMGMSRKEIASTLCVSINTAKKHLSNIYAKLGAQNRDQALDAIALSTSSEIADSTQSS